MNEICAAFWQTSESLKSRFLTHISHEIRTPMPTMDGHEATRRLRAAGYTGPIIALTASVAPDDRRRWV